MHHHAHHHDHGHGHHDHHGHGDEADPRGALGIALALNGAFLAVEAGVGWWSGSLALLSDAAHMLSDVGALVLALGAAQLARRPASARMTFGLDRAEPLGAFVNGLALLVAVVVIVVEALRRLTGDPAPVDGWPVLWVGLVGLGINLGSAWALWRSAPDNLNVRGALAHMLADAAGSVGAVAAAGLLLLGVQGADAAVSLFIAALVAWGAWQVTRDASRVLLQLPPPGLDMDALLRGLATLEGVADVHDVHVWTLDGRHPILTAHLVPGDGTDPGELTRRATDAVEHAFGVRHATFQIDPGTSVPCPTAHCGARAPAI